MINKLLTNKTAKEKADIKVKEIAKLKHSGRFIRGDLEIEIIDLKAIGGAVELFARAWENGKQLGFGKDGSVEIERFIIHNPPILVDDPNGTIIREWTEKDGTIKQRKLREDPKEAILQSLAHTISVVGKDGANIVKGKVGNTTSTFYPDADPETTSMDGDVFRSGTNETWATMRDGAGTGDDGAIRNPQINARLETGTSGYSTLARSIILFDTSSIPDTDTIDSATMSVYGATDSANNWTIDFAINIYTSTPASNTAIATADYIQVGTTAQATARVFSAFSASAYNDFVLNATGLGNISKTGITKFGMRIVHDADNTEPTFEASKDCLIKANSADQTGTANDPKLVVVHSAVATHRGFFGFMGM